MASRPDGLYTGIIKKVSSPGRAAAPTDAKQPFFIRRSSVSIRSRPILRLTEAADG